jgi:RNA polymerase sigma factor (sigma-70 family)
MTSGPISSPSPDRASGHTQRQRPHTVNQRAPDEQHHAHQEQPNPADQRRASPADEEQLVIVYEVARAAVRRRGANRYEADDAAQLTALKLWQAWHRPAIAELRSGASPGRWRSYIRRTAVNTYVDLIRNHQRRIQRHQTAAELQTGEPVSRAIERSTEVVEAWMGRDQLAREIFSLGGQQQRVAILLWLEELSSNEVAERLNIDAQTVRKHARLARAKLRERLDDHQY